MDDLDMRELNELYNKTKGRLFYQKDAAFLGRILAQTQFSWSRDIDTACISTKQLLWNPDFFLNQDQETRVTVLAHELWHSALLHHARIGNRCPDYWNQAGDHVINLLLKKHGYYMGGFPYLMDPKYDGWSTDEVYDDLFQEGGKPMNYVMMGDVSKDPMTDEDKAEAMGQVVGAISTSRIDMQPGDIPGELEKVLDEFLNPKLPWHAILYNYFNARVEDSYSFARPNRRYDDPILPGFIGRDGLEHLVFGADVSGSITDKQVLRFFSEAKFIQDDLKPEAMTLVTFDTEIQDVFRLERDDSFEKFEITYGGGTDLKDLYAFATAEGATALVIFTDLYVGIPQDPGFPVIWIVSENPSATVPYGTLIHLNE